MKWWLLAIALGTGYLTTRGIVPGLRQGQDFAPVYCCFPALDARPQPLR
jgi:hypothetical protein